MIWYITRTTKWYNTESKFYFMLNYILLSAKQLTDKRWTKN